MTSHHERGWYSRLSDADRVAEIECSRQGRHRRLAAAKVAAEDGRQRVQDIADRILAARPRRRVANDETSP